MDIALNRRVVCGDAAPLEAPITTCVLPLTLHSDSSEAQLAFVSCLCAINAVMYRTAD